MPRHARGFDTQAAFAHLCRRDRKLGALGEVFAEQPPAAILSANMGCITHLQSGTGIPVRHWVELLDEALLA